jgi:hypothetical protein
MREHGADDEGRTLTWPPPSRLSKVGSCGDGIDEEQKTRLDSSSLRRCPNKTVENAAQIHESILGIERKGKTGPAVLSSAAELRG